MTTRDEAIKSGLKRFTGQLCGRCGGTDRYTIGGKCVGCTVARDAARNALKATRRQNMLKALQVSRPHSTAARAKAKLKTLPLPKLREADVVPRLVPLIELDHTACRYPFDRNARGVYLFCGLSKSSSVAYCWPHMHLTHRPPDEPRERRFFKSSLGAAGLTAASSLAA
jgi:hypothetical protein